MPAEGNHRRAESRFICMKRKPTPGAAPVGRAPGKAKSAGEDHVDVAKRVFRDEIEGLERVEALIEDNFRDAVDMIFQCKGRLIISGVGKSGLIGKKIAATFTSTGTPSFYIHPVEAAHGDLGLVTPDDVVLFISKSGMSDEFRTLQPALGKLKVKIIAITGSTDSYLAKHSDIVLYCPVNHEACALDLAPTTSTTVALVMGDALACALMRTGDRVPLVRLDTSLKDGLFEMMSKAVGCVGVQDMDGKLCGIITDGDLKRILVRNPNAMDLIVEDIMTPNPKTIGGDVLAAAALNAMEINPSGPLTMYFITDASGQPTGVLHIHDILKAGLGVE
jgi:arabinose-5-phosphate isomerase